MNVSMPMSDLSGVDFTDSLATFLVSDNNLNNQDLI